MPKVPENTRDLDEDSLEDGVLSTCSNNENLTDCEDIWQTVEKKQVKVAAGKVAEINMNKKKGGTRKKNS